MPGTSRIAAHSVTGAGSSFLTWPVPSACRVRWGRQRSSSPWSSPGLQEADVARGLLVAGTTSDAGKSLVTAGICRWLAREGVSVAPFKAQNMSNNSMVCRDGSEIGRAQWIQALAAGAEPEAAMNPVLLKPGSDRRSHVVVLGRPWGHLESGEWATGPTALAEQAFAAYDDLAARFDVVIAEGAGSPAEINLREGDYVNLGLARAKDLPVVVVGDIDRGGVLAAMFGTLAILDPEDQVHVRAWIINKFRGDLDLLRPGLQMLEDRTDRPVLGVLPFLHDVWLDSEDSLATAGWSSQGARHGGERLTVAVVRLPRASNTTDADALAYEPGVDVVVTTDPRVVLAADLCVLPGTRATLSDLQWVRDNGLAEAVVRRVGAGLPVLGVCGGFQMLAERIDDPHSVESPCSATVRGSDSCRHGCASRSRSTSAHPPGAGAARRSRVTSSTTASAVSCGTATAKRSSTAGARARATARPGTAPSSPTTSAAPSSARWRTGPG